MKIDIRTLFFTVALLLDSIALSSQGNLRDKFRFGSNKIHLEPTLNLDIHSYEDTSGQIHPISPGPIEVGVHKSFIHGIVKDNVLCPVFDAEGHKVAVSTKYKVNVRLSEQSIGHIPFGERPKYTAPAVVRRPQN